MIFIFRFIGFLSLLLLSQSVFAQHEVLTEATVKKIDSLFNSYHQNDEAGSIFSVIKNDETIYTNQQGLANVEHQLPITDKTAFNIASNSKQFTTFLALMLEEDGQLSFDDDIRKHLPELKHLPYKITIKQLTNHTHGLPNSNELAQLKGVELMNHHQVVKMLLHVKEVNFKAGDKHEYNNTGYILLSEIIERVGEKSFKVQLQEKIFTPLGMKHTEAVDYNNSVVNNKAYSYRQLNGTYIIDPIVLTNIGSSGIYTTINDLELWAKNYHNITVGKREFYDRMQTISVLNSGKETNYGLGLQQDTYKGIDVVFHGGGTANYRSYILHAPEHKLSLLFLSNKGGMLGLDVLYKSLEIILKESVKEKKPDITVNNSALKMLEGTYEVSPGNYYTFTAEKENLYLQIIGNTGKTLLPVLDKNVFKFPFMPHSKFVFYKDRVDLHLADMTRPSPKTDIELPELEDINLNDFTGTYKNIEHNTTYELVVNDNSLMAIHSNIDYDIALQPIAKNSFYSGEPFFGKVDFLFDDNGVVNGFKVSGQFIMNVVFEKII